MVRIRKSNQYKREFTSSIAGDLNLTFNEDALKDMGVVFSSELGSRIVRGDDIKDEVKNNKIVLESNAGKMTVNEAFEEIRSLPRSTRSRIRSIEHLKAALKGIAVQQKLLKDAQDKDYDQLDVFQKKYENWFGANLIRFKYDRIYQDIQIPDSALIAYYEKHIKEFIREEHLNVQEILVLSEHDAGNIIEKLNQGADFTNLAKEYSKRDNAKQTGGVMGFVPLSRFGDLSETFASAPLNNIIGPLKINDFFIIARVTARQKARPLALNEVREAIWEVLKQAAKSSNIEKYLDNLKENTNILVHQDQVSNVQLLQ